jgi:hypothetical protein
MFANFFALVLGMSVTGTLGSFALLCGMVGLIFPTGRRIAQAVPGLWGTLLLRIGHLAILKRKLTLPAEHPPPYEGVTVLICNHPAFADTPALMGVLAQWGLHPSIVSKRENLRGVMGIFVGGPLYLMGRGVFISREEGERAKVILGMSVTELEESVLIFPDAHRPSKAAIRRDQAKFPNAKLTTLCVPRSGGVESLLKGLLVQNRSVRILDLTFGSGPKTLEVEWSDVTALFAENGTIIPAEKMRATLLDLWRKKEEKNLQIRP